MDRLREFLNTIKEQEHAQGNFLGLLNVLVGRKVALADGTVVSEGLTWRAAAAILKKVRWDREAVADLGIDPSSLPPRDREKYWYTAIAQARIDSDAAMQ